ncbi:MAG: Spermine synthase, partial [Verrucomicrobiales bacterium]|nr:Spermine synthase [Verrucomicrobiales bacterium]
MRFIVAILFFVSGFAALGSQIVWSKLFAAGLGHEIPSVLATVSALFFGMAGGACWMDRATARTMRPDRVFALLECVIGIWGVVSTFLIPEANRLALKLIGLDPSALRHWLIAFLIPCLALLPATFAMGATFPAMYKFVYTSSTNRRVIGGIYAANTFGAVAGVLFTTFILLPGISLPKGLFVCAALNLGVAAVMLFLPNGRRADREPDRNGESVDRKSASELFALGLLGIGFELWGTRMLSQVLENTIYTYATILAVFLAGLSAGAAFFQWFRRN